MISIAIINLKGGVGKSVTACNLAAELAAKSKSVLVVDLDKQGNTSKFFGWLDYDRLSVAEVLLGERFAHAAIVEDTGLPGVHLLPGDMRLLRANRMILMDTTEPQQYRLRDALEDVAENYDCCLLDCPPDLDMGSINALCAADWVIIPVDCDEWACDGMDEIIDQIERVQMYYNPRLKIMGAMMTKYRRTKYAADVIRQLRAQGVPMLRTVIRYTVKVSEAKSAHEPLRVYKPDCSAALDYRRLADEVDEAVSKMDTQREG
ncbi:MAG: ParA family protein [Gemmiger formicilis]|uniref:ParA family protein n=1 Tax=Gemmiger formicilis TaxID=745368 RepID=UPI003FEFCB9C|nr:ParA family protein [Gemmiger formicilis]